MARPLPSELCASRRSLIRSALAAGGVVLVPGALASCSSGGESESAESALETAVKGGTVPTSQVPVGQAIVSTVNGGAVVIAQPEAGSYVAFSAICTHQGAVVAAKEGLVLRCPAHGSEFDAGQDGKAVGPPATEPLHELPVTLNGADLVLG